MAIALALLAGCAATQKTGHSSWRGMSPQERLDRVAASPGLDTRILRYNQGQIEFVEKRAPMAAAAVPTVYIHGLGGNLGDFGPELLAADSASISIAMNLPGTGRSTGPVGGFTIQAFAHSLHEMLVLRMGHRQVDLVCHSLGGQVCMAFALDFPANVSSLTLIDAAGSYDQGEFVKRMAKQFAGVNLGDVLVSENPAIAMITGGNLNIINRVVGGNATALSALNSFNQNYQTRIPNISVPVLIIWGEKDPIFTVPNGFFLRNNIRGSSMKVVPNAGHVPQLTDPALVEGWIRDFHESIASHREPHENP